MVELTVVAEVVAAAAAEAAAAVQVLGSCIKYRRNEGM